MYSLGSVCAVGSWFCISVTSKVRKSFAEMVAESPVAAAALLLVPLVVLVPEVEVSIGAELPADSACPTVIA